MADSNQVRINELARELEIKAKVLIEYLPEAGVTEKKTHSSSIDLKHAEWCASTSAIWPQPNKPRGSGQEPPKPRPQEAGGEACHRCACRAAAVAAKPAAPRGACCSSSGCRPPRSACSAASPTAVPRRRPATLPRLPVATTAHPPATPATGAASSRSKAPPASPTAIRAPTWSPAASARQPQECARPVPRPGSPAAPRHCTPCRRTTSRATLSIASRDRLQARAPRPGAPQGMRPAGAPQQVSSRAAHRRVVPVVRRPASRRTAFAIPAAPRQRRCQAVATTRVPSGRQRPGAGSSEGGARQAALCAQARSARLGR